MMQEPFTNALVMKDVLAIQIGTPRDLFHDLEGFPADEAFAIRCVTVGDIQRMSTNVGRVGLDRLIQYQSNAQKRIHLMSHTSRNTIKRSIQPKCPLCYDTNVPWSQSSNQWFDIVV